MQNQNWIQVSQNPQNLSQITPQKNSWFLSRWCECCTWITVMFGMSGVIAGIIITMQINIYFVFLILFGVFLLGSSVFFCVQRSRETTKAVQRAHASYDVTQAQVPQYPVAVVPGPITMAGTQLPPGSYAADPPSYYLASTPNATPYYPESGSQPPEFSEVPPVETKM